MDDSGCPKGTCAGYIPAPERGDFDTSCPPGNKKPGGNGLIKVEPKDKRDKDVDGNPPKDYFLGEWKFVEGKKDLIVRAWCINQPQPGPDVFADYISFEIITSLNGKETEDADKKVDPVAPV